MYQTGFPSLGRRRSKDAERLAEIMRKHFDPMAKEREIAPAPEPEPKKRGRPRKAKA